MYFNDIRSPSCICVHLGQYTSIIGRHAVSHLHWCPIFARYICHVWSLYSLFQLLGHQCWKPEVDLSSPYPGSHCCKKLLMKLQREPQ